MASVTVKPGDSLSKIAKANNTTVAELLKLNPKLLSDPKYKGGKIIFSGTKINLPTPKKAPTAAQLKADSDARMAAGERARAGAAATSVVTTTSVTTTPVTTTPVTTTPTTVTPTTTEPTTTVITTTNPATTILTTGLFTAQQNGGVTYNTTDDQGGNLYPDLKQDTFSIEQLASRFGVAASILKQDPSLIKALNAILGMDENGNKISGMVTDPNLQMAILQQTDWFRNNTDDWRKFQFYKESNPATFQADLQTNATALVKKYFAMGIKLDPKDAIKLAQQAMMKSANINGNIVNYDQGYFDQIMADSIDFSKRRVLANGKVVYDLGGSLEKVAESLYKTAYEYGYQSTVSNKGFDDWMQSTVKGLVAGTINPEDVDNKLQSWSKSMYPGLTEQLTQGKTLRQAADPWINAVATEWEVDPSAIEVNDDFLFKALNQQDDKGNISPMNLFQTRQLARKSDKFQYTGKAKQEYTNISQKILQDFGFQG